MAIVDSIKIDVQVEKRIITGMIVSKIFLSYISPQIDLEYFQNSFTKTVAGWCLEFFDIYKEAPFNHIKDILESKRPSIKPDELEIIENLLIDINKRYTYESGLNVEYLHDQTTKFFKKRELEITNGNISVLLSQDKIEEAERELISFRKISKQLSGFSDPFNPQTIKNLFMSKEKGFFRFPGILGSFISDLRKQWLVGVSGGFKKGKTWFLIEFAVIGLLLRIKTSFFSLEMTTDEINERIYKRLTGTGTEEGGPAVYPCFDCYYNQHDSCVKSERTCNIKLVNSKGEKPTFNTKMTYRPCTICRAADPKEYKPETWFEMLNRPAYNYSTISKQMRAFKRQYDHLLKVKSYPKFSANVKDIEADLSILEYSHDFYSELIIVDHADILKAEHEGMSGVQKEDETWMNLARLAGEKRALLATGTQITKEALDAYVQKQRHTAKWVGKLGHVDQMITLNQTEMEELIGVMRIGKIADRHNKFSQNETCTILQHLKYGQPHLDSDYVERNLNKEV